MTRGAFNYQGDDSSIKVLLPEDPLGQLFLHWFNHCWRFILALTPEGGERPEWRTETRYPLEPRDLWDLYRDPEVLLGLCFGKYTRYLMGDIDRKSKNHPENNKERFEGILKAMEGIGLCRPIVVRSSESGGLHIYWFLPEEVHSWTLAFAAKRALNKADEHFKLIDGQLELFPNPKVFDPSKITNFKPHRLPLQAGSCLLDWDLQPICKSVGTLLDWADWSAEGQDMGALRVAMVKAEEHAKKEQYFWKRRQSGEQFAADLQNIMKTGWTAYGQTNFLLWKFTAYGIIFERLQNEDLFNWILKTVKNTSGYERFCRHQDEIDKRIREWIKCASKYYYPYPNHPPRDKTFKEALGKEKNNVVAFARSKQLRVETIERLKQVVSLLKKEGDYPKKVKAREDAIIGKSLEVYKKGFSGSTLYLKEYKYLWHPEYEGLGLEGENVADVDFKASKYPRLPDVWDLEEGEWEYKYLWEREGKEENREGVNPDSVVEKYEVLPDPWGCLDKGVEERRRGDLKGLQARNSNEGCLLSVAGKGTENEGRRGGEDSHTRVVGETSRSEGGAIAVGVNSSNPSLDLIILLLTSQILANPYRVNSSVNSNNSISSNRIQSLNSNSFNPLIQRNPDSINLVDFLNSLMELINSNQSDSQSEELINCFYELIYKNLTDFNYLELKDSSVFLYHKIILWLRRDFFVLKLWEPSSKQNLSNAGASKPLKVGLPASTCLSSNGENQEPCSLNSGRLGENEPLRKLNTNEPIHKELNERPREELTEEQQLALPYRQAIRLKLKAIREAKRLIQNFCRSRGLSLTSKVREFCEHLLKNSLFQHSPSPLLQAEAREWFAANREEINHLDGLDCFWDSFGDLVF